MNRVRMLIVTLVFLLPVNFAFAASESAKGKEKLTGDDERFVKEAASGGLMEVQLGKIAAGKASNQRVKEFGKRMQQDHGKANDQLKKIAANKGVELPKEPSGEHKRTLNRLTKLTGAEFDREYMEAMVDDHKEDIEKFEKQADKGKDPDVKKFASDNLPILRKHLELAQSTQKQLETGSKGDSKAAPKAGSK
jgi:putative membrane protein